MSDFFYSTENSEPMVAGRILSISTMTPHRLVGVYHGNIMTSDNRTLLFVCAYICATKAFYICCGSVCDDVCVILSVCVTFTTGGALVGNKTGYDF